MEQIRSIVIYYFSGTGNSKNVSYWLSQVASEKNIECREVNIASIDRKNPELPDKDALLVFISPVHGFNYPPIMMHFIFRFPKGRNKVVLMNTRAGMLIGKWVTPGLTGISFYLSALILRIKGYAIRAMMPVDLPSNWISFHPGLNDKTIKYLHIKNKERVIAFANKVFTGKKYFRCLFEIVQDTAISPIAVLYYFIGRFLLAKTFYASHDCNNCGICIKSCPVKAIIIIDKRPYWTFNCESCMKCMGNCPEKAIETAHGFIISYIIFNSMVIIVLFYSYFELFFFRIENEILKFIIEPLVFLSILALWHRIVHYLMRFRIVERIMVYTSLTKLKFWGKRYKALKQE